LLNTNESDFVLNNHFADDWFDYSHRRRRVHQRRVDRRMYNKRSTVEAFL